MWKMAVKWRICFCRLQMPNKAQLEADYHQRLTTRFSLKDATSGKAVTAHQTFVRLMNVQTKQEVIYVAEEDTDGTYRFDLVCNCIHWLTCVIVTFFLNDAACFD